MQKNVSIIGCSFSGMLTALSLADLGVNVTIIDSLNVDDPRFLQDIRTTALTSTSKNFLSKINLWQSVNTIANPILDVYVVDNKSPAMLHFAANVINYESLGYIVPNSQFKKCLLEAVRMNSRIRLIDKCQNYEIDSQDSYCNIILATGESLSGDLLILCCGRRSIAYQIYFSAEIKKYYKQHALTFYVYHEKCHEYTAVEHFTPTGPFAILPLQDQHYSSIVWTLPENYAKLLQNLPIDQLEYLAQKNFGTFLGAIKVQGEVASFPLQAYLAERYHYQRMMVIADTAHVVHPLAGQGLNQGIKDIDAIYNLINEQKICTETLQNYQDLRMYDNKMMYLITDNINRTFSNDMVFLRSGRRTVLKLLDNVSLIKNSILKYAMGER